MLYLIIFAFVVIFYKVPNSRYRPCNITNIPFFSDEDDTPIVPNKKTPKQLLHELKSLR